MKVRFAPRARRRAEQVAAWWRANRYAAPRLFDEELEQAVEALSHHSGLGLVYRTVGGKTVRRLLLPKTEQHL